MEQEKEMLQQNREEKDQFQNIFFLHLLFREKPQLPKQAQLLAALQQRFGEVDVVMPDKDKDGKENPMRSFAIKKYTCEFKDASVPAQIMIYGLEGHKAKDELTPLQRSQFWDVPNGAEVYDSCPYSIWISDFMSAVLPMHERITLLMDWLEVALTLLPDCVAVYTPSSGKLVTAEAARHNRAQGIDRFLTNCVNVRFFNIDGTEDDHIVDTTGLFSIDHPDLQYHFHGIDPNFVVNHAYNFASYLLANPGVMKDGDTVDGIDETTGRMRQDLQWRTRYEDALIQPVRPVLDVEPGPFASGKRNH